MSNGHPTAGLSPATSSVELLGLLLALRDHRTMLQAELGSWKRRHQTLVVDVDTDEGTLLLDELMPEPAPGRIGPGADLRLAGRLNNLPVRFHTRIEDVRADGRFMLYRCALPDDFAYRQRREAHRVPVKRDLGLRAVVMPGTRNPIVGELQDVSFLGCCVRFADRDLAAPILDLSEFPLQVETDDGPVLECRLNVRQVAPLPPRGVRIGGLLTDVCPDTATAVRRLVTACERELARLRSR